MRRAIKTYRLLGEGLTGHAGCRRLPHTPTPEPSMNPRIMAFAIFLICLGQLCFFISQMQPVEIGSAVSIDRIECSEGTTP
jgi:hypothetical protein